MILWKTWSRLKYDRFGLKRTYIANYAVLMFLGIIPLFIRVEHVDKEGF